MNAALSADWFCLYYPQLKIAYNVIPKNACSSVKLSLASANDGASFELTPHELDGRYKTPPSSLKGWSRLLVLRDPFDRLVSVYLDKIICPIEENAKIAVRQIARDNRRQPLGQEGISFAEFFDWITRQTVEHLDPHWRPQTELLRFSSFDRVLRVETLARDWHAKGLERIARLQSFNAHTTVGDSDLDTDLVDMLGHFIYGYVMTTARFPPRSCFARPELVARVRQFYAEDYALIDRLGMGAR